MDPSTRAEAPSNPRMARAVTLLPEPDSPTRPRTSPLRRVRLTPLTTSVPPKRTRRLRISSSGESVPPWTASGMEHQRLLQLEAEHGFGGNLDGFAVGEELGSEAAKAARHGPDGRSLTAAKGRAEQ